MKTERNELFRELTPPEGGAARMRARLAAEVSNAAKPRASNMSQTRPHYPSRRPAASWLIAAAGVATMVLIAVLTALAVRPGPATERGAPPGGELYAAADFDRLLGRPSTPFELSVSRGDERLELTEIPTRDPQVRIVRIEESSVN